MAAPPREQAAKVLVLLVAVAAFNALRRGELGDWTKAKFMNWGDDPKPDGVLSIADIIRDAATPPATVGAITGGLVGSQAGDGLVQVGSTKMSARFAARWRPLAAAAAADGVTLTGWAWRSPERQIELRKKNCPDWRNSPASACSPPTAKPGTSRHETGDAIDVQLTGRGGRNSPEYRWLAANAHRWQVHNLPSEPWHWSIDGK